MTDFRAQLDSALRHQYSIYDQRSHAESVLSRHKRRPG
jgi:hypothetical protein